MSEPQDSRKRTYFKSELLCASSFIDDVVSRWENSAGRLTGADADLVQLIRQKQQEWELAAGKCEYPPCQADAPSATPSSPSSKVILGPRYATSQMLPGGGLSFEGPMYRRIITQNDSTSRGDDAEMGEGVQQGFHSKGRHDPNAAEGASERASERPLQAGGRRERGYDRVNGRSYQGFPGSDAEVEDEHGLHGSERNGHGEKYGNGGSNEIGESNENGGTPETGGQKERRRQRLERKRKKENGERTETNRADGLFGPRVGFGAQTPAESHHVAEQESDPGTSHRNDRFERENAELGVGQFGGTWAGEGEGRDSGALTQGHVADDAMDYFSGPDLEPITNHTEADFPALGGGVAPPVAAAPLKRFTALKRPGSSVENVSGRVENVSGRGSSWAKLIGSKAAEREVGEEVLDVRNDEAFLEFEQKRAAFEEEDRRKRRTMRSKNDFECLERVKGRMVNTVQGLVLHENVLDGGEQSEVIRKIKELERLGMEGQLRGRTFTAPRKWKRGKGRVTIQFGCCYNYAVDLKGRPPGILQDEAVEPMPAFLEDIIDRMVRWKVMPGGSKRANSAIVNLYSEGDCIPIHIDHHDFDRPFCTISLQSVAPIKFGVYMESLDDGLFSGAFELPLPTGSVCILNGNAADVAKHCIPSVPAPRISITFRRMRPEKSPYINTVLPAPNHSVFHARAFSPSLIPPSLGPPQTEPARPASPLDDSTEAWPDLSGKAMGGPVEAGGKRTSGSPAWATNSVTRPPPTEAVPESRPSARQLLPRPLLARGSDSARVQDWPELGAGEKRRPLQRSSSTENVITDGADRGEPLPLRSTSRPASPVPTVGRSTSRDASPVQTIGRSRLRDASPAEPIRRVTSRDASPVQTIGRSTSRPVSPSVPPSDVEVGTFSTKSYPAEVSAAIDLHHAEPPNQNGLGSNQSVDAGPLESQTVLSAEGGLAPNLSADVGPEPNQESKPDPNPMSNPAPRLELADTDAQTPTVKASGLQARTEGSEFADVQMGANEKKHAMHAAGNVGDGHVSSQEWSSRTNGDRSPAAEKGSKGGRGSPPGFKVPSQSEQFGNGAIGDGGRGPSARSTTSKNGSGETSETGAQAQGLFSATPNPAEQGREAARNRRELSPFTGSPEINRPVEWRRERKTTEQQRGPSDMPKANVPERYDDGGAIAFGRFDDEHGTWSEERRVSPDPNQQRNGTERNGGERNGTERNGTELNGVERNATEWDGTERNGVERERNGLERNGTERNVQGRNGTGRNRAGRHRGRQGRRSGKSGAAGDWVSGQSPTEDGYPGPAQIDGDWKPGSRAGGSTSGAREYHGISVQGGVIPAQGYPGAESNAKLLATAPEFVPSPKSQALSHEGSANTSPVGGSNGAYSHQFGSNGSSYGAGYQQLGPNGTGYGAYSHQFEPDNRRASPGVSAPVQKEFDMREQATAGPEGDKPQSKVAWVDATCAFDGLAYDAASRPLDARSDGGRSAELSAAFTSPAAPFARFFPKETPKKTVQD